MRMYPVRDAWLKTTGYRVEIEGTDAVAEFHSGTPAENFANAQLFVRALSTKGADRG